MHGPWYSGTWMEEVTEKVDGFTVVTVYSTYGGKRRMCSRMAY
jgi:hypothetical protein